MFQGEQASFAPANEPQGDMLDHALWEKRREEYELLQRSSQPETQGGGEVTDHLKTIRALTNLAMDLRRMELPSETLFGHEELDEAA